MRKFVLIIVAALAAFVLASCETTNSSTDILPNNNNNNGGNNGGNNQGDESAFDVFASAGLTPTFTWEGGGAHSVSIVRADNPANIQWSVAFLGLTDGIASGVTYGEVPGGSVQAVAPVALQAGVEYRVSVARSADNTVGWVEFTP
jgi:hypothetical protein